MYSSSTFGVDYDYDDDYDDDCDLTNHEWGQYVVIDSIVPPLHKPSSLPPLPSFKSQNTYTNVLYKPPILYNQLNVNIVFTLFQKIDWVMNQTLKLFGIHFT